MVTGASSVQFRQGQTSMQHADAIAIAMQQDKSLQIWQVHLSIR
jgi:hypothetical protein